MALKSEGLEGRRNFHMVINLVLFSKLRTYEIKYRAKICDFTVICELTAGSNEKKKHSAAKPWIELVSSDCRSDALTTEL